MIEDAVKDADKCFKIIKLKKNLNSTELHKYLGKSMN